MRKVISIGSPLIRHHLILSEDGIDLIDGGFIGGLSRIKKALAQHNRDLSEVRSLILTHGHLDHTLNASRLQKQTGCRVFAPRLDRDHVEGRHQYRGWNRVCDWLEKAGRVVLRHQLPVVDQWFDPGDLIHGLEVVGLPGHTNGHCGLLLPEQKLLIAGDLFTNHFGGPSMPPRFLNDDQDEARRSIRKAAQLDLNGILLNHARKMTPEESLSALIHLANHL